MQEFIQAFGAYLVYDQKFKYLENMRIFIKERPEMFIGYLCIPIHHHEELMVLKSALTQIQENLSIAYKKPVKILIIGISEDDFLQPNHPAFCLVNLRRNTLQYLQPAMPEMTELVEHIRNASTTKAISLSNFREEFQDITPKATYILLFINILIFIVGVGINHFYQANYLTYYGAKINELIVRGQYYRLITAMFLHGNIIHILLNMVALYNVGLLAERIFGTSRFLYLYFAAGVGGNILSYMFSPYPAVGASGAIFGVMGMLLYFGHKRPKMFKSIFGSQLYIVLGINLVYGFMMPNIDNYAHIGGLFVGYLASYSVGLPTEKQYNKENITLAVLITLCFIAILAVLGSWMDVNRAFK